jgi:hypothetical protein
MTETYSNTIFLVDICNCGTEINGVKFKTHEAVILSVVLYGC